MRKAEQPSGNDGIVVEIGRFGANPGEFTLPVDTTVDGALREAGIELTGNERVWVNGVRANLADILENGDVVNVVSSKEAGTN